MLGHVQTPGRRPDPPLAIIPHNPDFHCVLLSICLTIARFINPSLSNNSSNAPLILFNLMFINTMLDVDAIFSSYVIFYLYSAVCVWVVVTYEMYLSDNLVFDICKVWNKLHFDTFLLLLQLKESHYMKVSKVSIKNTK